MCQHNKMGRAIVYFGHALYYRKTLPVSDFVTLCQRLFQGKASKLMRQACYHSKAHPQATDRADDL
jgi:hypothetical protein